MATYNLIYPSFRLADPAERYKIGTLAEFVRPYARVDCEDDVIGSMLDMLAGWAERHCDQPLFERTYIMNLPGFYSGVFPVQHVGEIVQVRYQQTFGGEWVDVADTEYVLTGTTLTFSETVTGLTNLETVEVTFKSGWTANNMPPDLKLRLAMFVTNNYDNRAALDEDLVAAIFREYRMVSV